MNFLSRTQYVNYPPLFYKFELIIVLFLGFFHSYYHVFKQGELESLIEKYVHSLHILKSYYDHSNWCIVAERVQVWTI